MRLSRPSVYRTALAGAAVAVGAAAVLPAGAATTTTPSKGDAASTITALSLSVAGKTISVGKIAAVAGNSSKRVAQLVVTPLESSATGAVGQVTVTPANSPVTTPVKSVSLPASLGSVTGPSLVAKASDTAAGQLASAAASGLGKVTLAVASLDLSNSSLADTATVTKTGVTSQKSLTVGKLSLPSIADLLGALGLDLSKLTANQLTALVGVVQSTLSSAITSANQTITSLQSQLNTAAATIPAANDLLSTKQAQQSAASQAFAAALQQVSLAAVNTQLTAAGAPNISALSPSTWNTLTATQQGIVDTATAANLASLDSALDAANDAVAAAQQLVDALADLLAAVTNALDADPLAVLSGVTVQTKAVAANKPDAVASVTAAGVDVLGATKSLSTVTSALSAVTKPLTDVLKTAGVTLTPPSVALGSPQTSKGITGTTRHAEASITGLTLTLPSIQLPQALAVTGAPLSTPTGALKLGVLADTAKFTPGTSRTTTTPQTPNTPATGKPQTPGTPLPDTGGRILLPVLAALMAAGGLALRRRSLRTSTDS